LAKIKIRKYFYYQLLSVTFCSLGSYYILYDTPPQSVLFLKGEITKVSHLYNARVEVQPAGHRIPL